MDEYASLSHAKWECKYHVVFIPKCRRKVLYGTMRRHLGEVFRKLAEQKESRIEEGHLMPDHVHMMISIPPKYAVSQVIGFIKGKSAIHVARARGKSFLPRAPELAILIREAFLRGISTRQMGRVVATLTGEAVSAQTVSRLTRALDQEVREFHRSALKDEWAYLFLDGVALKVRRPPGRQQVQMLVAHGVRRDGTRQLLGFLRTQGESQAHSEALLEDLYRRGLKGDKLLLIVTDGCPGLAAAIQTVYPRVAH